MIFNKFFDDFHEIIFISFQYCLFKIEYISIIIKDNNFSHSFSIKISNLGKFMIKENDIQTYFLLNESWLKSSIIKY
jgi:anaerobic ribonucleoside-triphosphate reductase